MTLPVGDVAEARAFYAALGFSINEPASDETMAAVVLDENIVARLLPSETASPNWWLGMSATPLK